MGKREKDAAQKLSEEIVAALNAYREPPSIPANLADYVSSSVKERVKGYYNKKKSDEEAAKRAAVWQGPGSQRERDEYGKIISVINDPVKLNAISKETLESYIKRLTEIQSFFRRPVEEGQEVPQYRPQPLALAGGIRRAALVIECKKKGGPLPFFGKPLDEPLAERFSELNEREYAPELIEHKASQVTQTELDAAFKDTVKFIHESARLNIVAAHASEIERLAKLTRKGLPLEAARKRLDSPELRAHIEKEYDAYILGRGRNIPGPRKNELFKRIFEHEHLHPFLDSLLKHEVRRER